MSAFDVAIVGAGPAGLDRRLPARVGGRARAARRQGDASRATSRAAAASPCARRGCCRSRSSRSSRTSSTGSSAGSHYGPRLRARARARRSRYMTQRKRLDHFLLEQAAAAGADVRDGVKVADVRADALTVDGDEIARAHRDRRRRLQRHDRARARPRAATIVHGVALEANFPHDARFAHAMVLEIAVVPRRLRLGLPEGRPRQRRRRRRRERRAAACARSCAGSARRTASIPTRATDTRGYRLPMRRAGSRARARHDRGDRRRGRPRRPVLAATACTRRSSPRSSSPTPRSTCSPAAPRASSRTPPRSSAGSRR